MANKETQSKKILLLVHENIFGGGTRQAFYIIQGLIQRGYAVVLFSNTRNTWLGEELRRTNTQVTQYDISIVSNQVKPFQDFKNFVKLIWVIRKEKPVASVASGIKLTGIGAAASWLTGIGRYAVVRGQSAAPGSAVLKVISMMMRFMDRLGTRFITVSNYDRSDLIMRKICRESQVTAIHDGIDLRKFNQKCPGQFRSRYNLPEGAYIVGMVGRLTFQKRYADFVAFMGELCKRKENVYGFLIGEGEDREKLQRQIDALNLTDRVRITGFIDHMHEVYSDLNLTVLFSNFEGLSNVLIESAAAGIPQIANDVCGNREVVIHEENGYLVKTGDIIQAVSYAEKLMENPDVAQRLGERGEIAHRCFDKEKQVAKLIDMVTGS